MPTDTQVPGGEEQDAPSDYRVPNTVEFLLKAVNANFIDNSAAGDWLPAVVITSDAGKIVARAVDQGVKVTAGDDAEVSWFPGVKHAAAATASTVGAWCFAEGTVDTGGTLPAYFDFVTLDPTMYALSGGSDSIQILQTGSYAAIAVETLQSSTVTATDSLELAMTVGGSGNHDDLAINGPWIVVSAASGGAGLRDWQPSMIRLITINTITIPGNPPHVDITAVRRPAGSATGIDVSLGIVRLGPPLGGNL